MMQSWYIFGSEHLPYGILAIVMLSVFNILPALLLLLYPWWLLSEMSDLLWHQECYTAHLHGRPSRLLPLPAKRLQVLCWYLFVCEDLIPGHFCHDSRPDDNNSCWGLLRTSSRHSDFY